MQTSPSTHIFTPIATKTAGSWNQQAIDVNEYIDRLISVATEVPLETTCLFQHISDAIQRGNTVSFMSTIDNE